MAREHAHANWTLSKVNGITEHSSAQLSVQMDIRDNLAAIRDELHRLNEIIYCQPASTSAIIPIDKDKPKG